MRLSLAHSCLHLLARIRAHHMSSAGESMEAVAMVQDIIMRDTSGMLLFGIVHGGKDDGVPPAKPAPSSGRP